MTTSTTKGFTAPCHVSRAFVLKVNGQPKVADLRWMDNAIANGFVWSMPLERVKGLGWDKAHVVSFSRLSPELRCDGCR